MQPTPILQKAIRRLRLTTKQAPKGYYKGTGTGSMGTHTRYGRFTLDYNKIRTYMVPDLTSFELTPFVSKRVEAHVSTRSYSGTSPMDARLLIQQWKEAGGFD